MNQPPTASPPDSSQPPAAERGDWPSEIAGFAIKRLLGEGGMGRVFLAQQAEPHRDVALKVMRSLDAQSLARFRREAELLAALEHPGIARLYASGETEFAGMHLPWLAMEYIKGNDLLSFAESNGLGMQARLRLLIGICRAVHFAHARGVIHRDLKPGNILVDDDGRPRVLDFGIARMIAEGQTMTQAGQVLGTLPYMSPEQLGGRERQVDIRTDVYALGVIAYELIARRLPFPKLSTSTLIEALDIVRKETPPRLSSLSAQARGDLDWVVMKALASEPERRYSSAAEFAADLERVLDHRPVEARPPTLRYLAGRFIRRNRMLSGAAAVILLVLIGATVVSLRYALAEAEARRLAEQRAAEAQAVTGFLQSALRAAHPDEAQGRPMTVADLLVQAESGLEKAELPASAEIALLETLASTQIGLGQFAQGERLVDLALERLRAQGATDSAAEGALLRAKLIALTEQAKFAEAEAVAQSLRPLMVEFEPVQRWATELSMARLSYDQGQVENAEQAYQALLASMQTGLPDDAPPASQAEYAVTFDTVRSNLVTLYRDAGQLATAMPLSEAVLGDRKDRLGDRHPLTLSSAVKHAQLLQSMGQAQPALEQLRQAVAQQREVLGPQHPDTLHSLQALANAELAAGNRDQAETFTREALAGSQAQFGPRHAQVIAAKNVLAYILEDRGALAEAEVMYRDLLASVEASGNKGPDLLASRNNLAMLLSKRDSHGEALAEFEKLLPETEGMVGRKHLIHAIFSSNYGLALQRAGRSNQAVAVLQDAVQRLNDSVGKDHARTITAQQRLDEAERAAKE